MVSLRRITNRMPRRVTHSSGSGRIWTPNDVVINGTRACVGWWISNNGALPYGSVTLDEASVPADQSTWDSNLEVTVGGGNAVKATTASSRHYCYESSPTAVIGSWCEIDISGCAAQGSQVWVRVWAGSDWCNVNLSTGGEGNKSGATVSCTAGVVLFASVAARDCRVELLEPALGDDATATPSAYAGSTSDGYTGNVTFRQPRVAIIADESLTAKGEKRNANVAQGVDASQPLFYMGFASVNGLPVAYQEHGRTASCTTNNADVLGIVNGDDPNFCCMAVCKIPSSGSGAPFMWSDGANVDMPLFRNGADLQSQHIADVQTYGSGLASLLDSAAHVTIVGYGTRQRALYINGTFRATVAHADQAAYTSTILWVARPGTARECMFAEGAVFSDLSSLGGHATIASALMSQGGGSAMMARWGLA